ncbi:putative inactive purple acid phosphatase 27 [Morella rubra]|uniref:Putative inactive purple acid phosphatase 27 n=1 Tax=Morella rubra TaxID=262757 RepID=A0A6A1WMF6_9ROSI|nr:putative inactive purple acid phosphatase 27 [Morella rubra]
MDPSSSSGILKLLLLLTAILGYYSTTSYAASSLHPLAARSLDEHRNYTAISDFRVVNRRKLLTCPDPNPYLRITVSPNTPMSDVEYLTVTVSGVLIPDSSDWVAMISPSSENVTDCPSSEAYYLQTGDTSSLPLLCQYPVKAQYVSNDPNYLSCKNKQCQVVNIRTDIEFVFFTGGFDIPCILTRSSPLTFANPNMPLNGHLSSIDSSGASMRLTWVSGNGAPQQVQYGNGMSQTSVVSTFTQADMCTNSDLPSPAADFGWHDPGFIHSAIMKGLQPSSTFFYRYGRAFQNFYIVNEPGSISVINAVTDQVNSVNVDSIFHIGDISYATGFLVEWDFFLSLIKPVASKVSYMTAIGNHERHRPMYTSSNPVTSVDPLFVVAVEPLLLQYKVDLALFGHVHNYERTCAVYQGQCLAVPTKDANGVDTYNNTNYSAPVQAIIGMAGFTLDNFTNTNSWSLVRISEFGYVRVNVTATELYWEFVDSITRNVEDSFRIIK